MKRFGLDLNSIRSVDPYPDRIRNPDPDPGQKMTHKNRKNKKFRFKVLDVLFRGLKAFSVAWTSFMEAYG
jgi:hypothetical protein